MLVLSRDWIKSSNHASPPYVQLRKIMVNQLIELSALHTILGFVRHSFPGNPEQMVINLKTLPAVFETFLKIPFIGLLNLLNS